MNGDRNDLYTHAIGALAEDARMAPASATRIERELLSAFAEHRAAVSPVPSTRPPGVWRPWMAAAAALIAVAAFIGMWRLQNVVTVNNVTKTSSREDTPALPGSPPVSPGVVPATPPSMPPRHVASARTAGERRRIVKPAGFVALPGAANLPQFESGTIVRVELAVASLPAYGVDISPAANDQPVEADVLVGQDGQPRAIRLVTSSSRSGQ
jgi:hypothetical protein